MVNNKTSFVCKNQSQREKRVQKKKESAVMRKVVPIQFKLRGLTCDVPRYKGMLI